MHDDTPDRPADPSDDRLAPAYAQVQQYLLYTLSLPERAVRSSSGLVGGVLQSSSSLLLPSAFRSSQTYQLLVGQMLELLAHDVGRVERRASGGAEESAAGDDTSTDADPAVDNYVARKAVGNFVDLAGMATLHLSPLTVLAVVSDVAYGSQAFLQELSQELKRDGVIDPDSTIDHAGDLLDAIGKATRVASDTLDTPPLSVEGMRQTVDQTTAAVSEIDPVSVIPQAEIERLWAELHELADREGVGLLEISSAVTLHSLGKIGTVGGGALSSARAAGNLVDRHFLEHYREALDDIRERGYYASLAASAGPYIDSVWRNFSHDEPTVTEELLTGRLLGKAARTVTGWLGPRGSASERPEAGREPSQLERDDA